MKKKLYFKTLLLFSLIKRMKIKNNSHCIDLFNDKLYQTPII